MLAKHRRDIDGIRAIAVLAVIGFHCGWRPFSGGFIGVDVFFVVSGYLICGLISRDIDAGQFSIARFYERRSKRILPALCAVLIACLLLGVFVLSPAEARRLGVSVASTALSLSNFYFYRAGDYFHSSLELNPLLMTWSLAVEEQFYLGFPLLLLLLNRLGKSRLKCLAIIILGSLGLAIVASAHWQQLNFYMPFTRAWELAAGSILACWERDHEGTVLPRFFREVSGAAGMAMIACCTFLYSSGMRFPGIAAVPPVLATVLLISARDSVANDLLSLEPFTSLGLMSYSLYLWHWPILSFARILGLEPRAPGANAILMLLACAAASLSYHFIEGPFRKRESHSTKRVLLSYASALAGIALVAGLLAVTNGLPQRSKQLRQIEAAAGLERKHECLATDDVPRTNAACLPAISSRPAVALLGDSHAEALADSLREAAAAHDLNLVVLTKANCPPLQGITRWHPINHENARSCAQFNQRALELIAKRPDVKFVVLAGSWSAPGGKFVDSAGPESGDRLSVEASVANLNKGLQAEIADLEFAQKRVIVVDDVPMLDFDPMQLARDSELPVRRTLAMMLAGRNFRDPEDKTVTRADSVSHTAQLDSALISSLAQSDLKLTLLRPSAVFCDTGACAFAEKNGFYYSDPEHLSSLGATKVLSQLSWAKLGL